MGKIKYIKDVRKFFKKSHVVGITSLKNFISKYGGNKNYVYVLVNNMMKKDEIRRITKGYYTIHEDPGLAVFCFKPSYLGLQDALSIHNLWEQETNPVIITTKKIRPGTRKVLDSNILIRRISKKYFFGFGYIKHGDFYVPVSDIEKTFIDMVYFKQELDKDLLKNFKKRVNKKRLKRYLKRYPKRIKIKVLKYFFDILSSSN